MKRVLLLALGVATALACSSQYSSRTTTTSARVELQQRRIPPPPSPAPSLGQIPNSDVPLPVVPPPTPTRPQGPVRETTMLVQSRDPVDLHMTASLRSQVLDDDTLSPEAKRVRIVTSGRRVVLEGRVRSERERDDIDAKARALPDLIDVDDRIVIAP